MKKFFSVFMIAVCCMALAMPAQAQLIKFGVKGGVNLSKLKFEGMKDNSTGFFFGPMAEITIPVIGWEWTVRCCILRKAIRWKALI